MERRTADATCMSQKGLNYTNVLWLCNFWIIVNPTNA